MKNLFILGFAGFLSYSTVYAQGPVLTREKMMTFGSVCQLANVSESTIDLIDFNKTGENQIWDFSQIENMNPDVTCISTIEQPINTPYYANYAQSNYVMVEKEFDKSAEVSVRYNYYLLSDTKLERLGSTIPDTDVSYYSDPQTEYVFPLNYGTIDEDTWSSSSSFFPGSTHLECVGSGTLKLPNGTHENVLMVHFVTQDLIVFDNYFWFSENGALLLAHNTADYIFETYVSAKYATSINAVVGLGSVKSTVNSIQYNNPVQDILALTMEITDNTPELKLSIANTSGFTVFSKDFRSLGYGTNTIDLDLSHLNPGVYFLTINRTSSSSSKPEIIKIIKQ